MRIAIERVVTEAPGVSIAAVGRALGAPHATVSYHVALLEERGRVVRHKRGNARGIFPKTFASPEVREMVMLSRDSMTMLMLDLLDLGEPPDTRSLMRQLGVSPATVAFHLRKLERLGLVETTFQGRGRRFGVDKARQQILVQATQRTLGLA